MDYSEAYVRASQSLRDIYNKANEKNFDLAESHAVDLLLLAKVLLADIQNKK
jgi:hypothetical protein